MAQPIPGLTPKPADAIPIIQAASLLLGVLRAARATCWDDLGGVLPATITLTDEQIDLLNEHREAIALLRYGVGTTVTIAGCCQCLRWALVGPNSPEKCWLTHGCTGSVKRACAAARTKPDSPPQTALE